MGYCYRFTLEIQAIFHKYLTGTDLVHVACSWVFSEPPSFLDISEKYFYHWIIYRTMHRPSNTYHNLQNNWLWSHRWGIKCISTALKYNSGGLLTWDYVQCKSKDCGFIASKMKDSIWRYWCGIQSLINNWERPSAVQTQSHYSLILIDLIQVKYYEKITQMNISVSFDKLSWNKCHILQWDF